MGDLRHGAALDSEQGAVPAMRSRLFADVALRPDKRSATSVRGNRGLARRRDLNQAVLERWGTSAGEPDQRFLLEGRFDFPAITAQLMVGAARALPRLAPRAHRLCDLPPAALLPANADY